MAGSISSTSSNLFLASKRLFSQDEYIKPLEDYKIIEDIKKDVIVYLCRKLINDCLNLPSMTHWSLVFHFKEMGLYIAYQAVDSKGNLVPSRNVYQELPEEGAIKPVQLAELSISLAALHNAASAIDSSNKPYCVQYNNCQTWVWFLCKSLGISEKLKNITTFYSTLQLTDTVILSGIGTPVALGVLGAMTLTDTIQKKNQFGQRE